MKEKELDGLITISQNTDRSKEVTLQVQVRSNYHNKRNLPLIKRTYLRIWRVKSN